MPVFFPVSKIMMKNGLYHHDQARDSCGFGLVTQVRGEESHRLLRTAIGAMINMSHRGGINADGGTGDGCGLLFRKPDAFLRAVAAEIPACTLAPLYAAGNIFLSTEPARAAHAIAVLERELCAEGLVPAAWRPLPVREQVCAPLGRSSLPRIEQLFVNAPDGCDEPEFGVRLFRARRRAEHALAGDEDFYVCSLSPRVLGYKALVLPAQFQEFYPDLADERLRSSICVFHVRYCTNTLPRWNLAQPFRMLAHNGEINTIFANRNWAEARAGKFCCERLPDIESLSPLVNREGSDSSTVDNMLELLLAGGMDLFRALRVMIPPAWENHPLFDEENRAFYEYHSMHMEPWDGPAGIVLTEGRYAVCLLDRNGLRPARWLMTRDGFLLAASESGVLREAAENITRMGRVGPGGILVVDTETGAILETPEVEARLKREHPYGDWLRRHSRTLPDTEQTVLDLLPEGLLDVYRKQFQANTEEYTQILRPLAEGGQEPVGAMGDDIPMSVLSRQVRPLYDLFRQQFAQVTNPAIDPLRETVVMSLGVCLGRERGVLEPGPAHAERVFLSSPVLTPAEFGALQDLPAPFVPHRIDCCYDPAEKNLSTAIGDIARQAVAAVQNGSVLLVLSDRAIARDRLPVHSLLAVGAVHQHLVQQGLRCEANIVAETGSARDPHQVATLFGFGATVVYPYLAFSLVALVADQARGVLSLEEVQRNYRAGIGKGLLKICSKLGISTISGYRGAALFETIGLADEVVALCFQGVENRIGGMNFSDLEEDLKILSNEAWRQRLPVPAGGLMKYMQNGEYHAFNADVVQSLRRAVTGRKEQDWREYSALVNQRDTAMLRDMLALRPAARPLPVAEVEATEQILPRFDTAGMSLGALSPEAHETLAVAMNRLGGRSNSGEGGEDPARYHDERCSKIKQVASGRFGVTPYYLVNAEVLQIKIAQGAKPGEGGQLPGGKVNELIARLRHSVPGVGLISPPPHHDVYSIEDLAQLIYDLKEVNEQALVSVKLVAEPGVGTVAAGVAKAGADLITISGYDGGTAASPLSSIRYAGSPWELGLSETQQALRANGLRGRIRLQVDGGLKTGLDVIKGAILGAESFGFGTAPMVAMGCKYLRICHLNNCATGVATQDQRLREKHFIGEVEMVMHFFHSIAEEVRQHLAVLGARRFSDIIGHPELLRALPGDNPRRNRIDFRPILVPGDAPEEEARYCEVPRNVARGDRSLAEHLSREAEPLVQAGGGSLHLPICNTDRAVGARLSGRVSQLHGARGALDCPIELRFTGTAGQSFGAWNAPGLHLHLEGDANDYVGKGMAGGRIVLRPPAGAAFLAHETPIAGNTCLYGATGGEFFAAGRAGERFGVRNSGCHAVIEGTGDHCCEYMTGGIIVVLGKCGINFGAGMTNGIAFVVDEQQDFHLRCNTELVRILHLGALSGVGAEDFLLELLEEFVRCTDSVSGRDFLQNFRRRRKQFRVVVPASEVENLDALLARERARRQPETGDAGEELIARAAV